MNKQGSKVDKLEEEVKGINEYLESARGEVKKCSMRMWPHSKKR